MSLAAWEVEDHLLIVYLLRDVSESDPASRDDLGRVEVISLCTVSSFLSYESVVAIAIEQIRNGQTPTRLDEMAIIEVDLDAPYLQKEYNILDISPALMGGASVTVGFEGGPILHFWLYPLAWQFPVIRVISKLDEDGKLVRKLKGENVSSQKDDA